MKIKKIGLTGGIGSGKTTVAKIFAELGYTIIDADQVAHEVVMPGRFELEEIKNAFGISVMKGASLDRKKLGQMVFADPRALKKLNAILQPSIKQLMQMRMEFLENEGRVHTLIVDIPLLYERHWERDLDAVIVVDANKKTRIDRIMQRDHLSQQDAVNRIAAQMPLAQKAAMADFVIENTGDKDALKQCVLQFISENSLQA
ncbi:dephospho-CoA kinase [Oenococcus kitaharae]|uniref:dephospho-CoA kinase n=1 Tax=Oenococcus TaxID=46254 RepID=UPI0021E7B7BA|nr:dephospho-CoA kinase [Oenococcus kitaharae]